MISFETTFLDYPSPDDIAVIVFLSGCSHQCPGCQNYKIQQVHKPWTEEETKNIITEIQNLCYRNETNKIVLSGGDPLHPCNRNLTINICKELGNNYDICIYTGYEIEEVKQMNISGFKYVKCGKFDCEHLQKAEKTDTYIQFVNETQNLYDNNYQQLSYKGKFNF